MARAGGGRAKARSGGGRSSSRSGGGHRVGGGSRSRARGGGSSGSSSFRSSSSRRSGGSFGGGGRTSSPPRSSFGGGPRPGGGPGGGFGGPRGFGGPGPGGGPRRGFGGPRLGGPGMPPPPPRGGRRVYRGGGNGGGCLTTTILLIIILIAIFGLMKGMVGYAMDLRDPFASRQSSTIVRDRIESGNAYINDCIIDELGWFDSISKTANGLKEFWEETGVQPYIILKDYDASLTTDEQKEQWTIDYYDENFTAENIFLYVYFAEQNTDVDVGYMCYANGMQTSSVMDSEAIEIFWNNIDKYWYTDLSTDEVFINTFTETAKTIMYVPTNAADVVKDVVNVGGSILKVVLVIAAVIIVGIIVIVVIGMRMNRKKEEEAERQRILDTPIDEIVNDDLTNKYL